MSNFWKSLIIALAGIAAGVLLSLWVVNATHKKTPGQYDAESVLFGANRGFIAATRIYRATSLNEQTAAINEWKRYSDSLTTVAGVKK